MSGGGTRVAGNTIAATRVREKYSAYNWRSAGKVLVARGGVDGLGNEIGTARQHIAAKHRLDIRARARNQLLQRDAGPVLFEIAGQREPDVVILHLIGRQVDEPREAGHLRFDEFCTRVLESRQGKVRDCARPRSRDP